MGQRKRKMAPQKYGAIHERKESVSLPETKAGSKEPFALTALKADARNVAVADVGLGPGHQPPVDLRDQAAEQGVGGGKGNGSGLGHFHSLVFGAAMAALSAAIVV